MNQRIEINSPESNLKAVYYESKARRRVWNHRPKILAETNDGQTCQQVGIYQIGSNLDRALATFKRQSNRQDLFEDLAFIIGDSGDIIEQKETTGQKKTRIVGVWEPI